jgi:hypothetical protein
MKSIYSHLRLRVINAGSDNYKRPARFGLQAAKGLSRQAGRQQGRNERNKMTKRKKKK